MLLQGGQPGFDDHVILEVENPLEILEGHVDQEADAARQRLQKPDVGDRGSQLDMTHPVAAHLRKSDLHTAFFADYAAIFHTLVLAAQAFVILYRSKNPGAEQPVALR